MIRYSLFLAIVAATAATAIAAIAPHNEMPLAGANVTVIAKNQAFPVLGPISVTPCKVEDCSDTAG